MSNYKVKLPTLSNTYVFISLEADDTKDAISKAVEICRRRNINLPTKPEGWAVAIKSKGE